MTNNPSEAPDYLRYLKCLAIKDTRFQTEAILAFDQDLRATKSRENFTRGSNVYDLSAQYFDGAVALHQTPTSPFLSIDGRKSTSDQFCFRWNFSPNGCPNIQSCKFKHVCIHCWQQQKSKAYTALLVLLAARNRKNDFLHDQKTPVILPHLRTHLSLT